MTTKTNKTSGPPPLARNKLDAMGVDTFCDQVASGETFRGIARQLGISLGSIITWVESDADRSARVSQARVQSAQVWDELAEEEIRKASDPFEITRARELASHYRWRAKVVSPRIYGDKVTQEHTGADGGAIKIAAMDFKGLTDEELAQMQQMMMKAASK